MPNTRSNRVALLVLVLAVLVGGLVTAFVLPVRATDGELLVLEPRDAPGDDPFVVPDPSAVPDPAGPPADAPVAAAPAPADGSSPGAQPCDLDALITRLSADPARAAAWTAALNADPTLRWSGGSSVSVAQIPAFLRELTPHVLTADLHVTNHRYLDGRAGPIQAVLQAGTAVLVDAAGIARVRCACGNPLAPRRPLTAAPVYRGERWPDFDGLAVTTADPTRCAGGQARCADLPLLPRPEAVVTDGRVPVVRPLPGEPTGTPAEPAQPESAGVPAQRERAGAPSEPAQRERAEAPSEPAQPEPAGAPSEPAQPEPARTPPPDASQAAPTGERPAPPAQEEPGDGGPGGGDVAATPDAAPSAVPDRPRRRIDVEPADPSVRPEDVPPSVAPGVPEGPSSEPAAGTSAPERPEPPVPPSPAPARDEEPGPGATSSVVEPTRPAPEPTTSVSSAQPSGPPPVRPTPSLPPTTPAGTADARPVPTDACPSRDADTRCAVRDR